MADLTQEKEFRCKKSMVSLPKKDCCRTTQNMKKKTDKFPIKVPLKHEKMATYTTELVNKIAVDIVEWSKRPDSYFLNEFCCEYPVDINVTDLREVCRKSPQFDRIWQKVKRRLINRLDKLALSKKVDGNYLHKIKPLIDEEYRAWRLQELKSEELSSGNRVIEVTINPTKGLPIETVQTIEVKPSLQEQR